MIIPEVSYALFCIILAAINDDRIKDGKKIRHFWNGLCHLCVAIPAAIFIHWTVGLVILCNSRVIFDISLNAMRGLPFDYVPLKPKSIVDQIEIKLFGRNGWIPKILYAGISIAANIYYFNSVA